nr:hypothetical protein BSM_25160 [uncultured archaeon]CBH39350.1 hypothetical protein BSM_28290 [uncultured archaeon]
MAIYAIEYMQKLTTAQKAVARYLERHNDLGIHSELFVPARVDLIALINLSNELSTCKHNEQESIISN